MVKTYRNYSYYITQLSNEPSEEKIIATTCLQPTEMDFTYTGKYPPVCCSTYTAH